MKNFISILILILSYNMNAQSQRDSYCECKIKGTRIIDSLIEEKVSLNASYSKKCIYPKIVNNTKDTIFVFSSYFNDDISNSKYLYRYNKKSKKINISYAPILPYLFTKYSDKIILEDKIIKDYQVVYDFYKIPPNYEYSFRIKTVDIDKMREFIEDFDVYKLNKFEKIKKFKRSNLRNNNHSFYLSIAYYKKTNMICKSTSYYQEELKFNDAAKDFKLLQCSIKMDNNIGNCSD